jgi:hypothetical protein
MPMVVDFRDTDLSLSREETFWLGHLLMFLGIQEITEKNVQDFQERAIFYNALFPDSFTLNKRANAWLFNLKDCKQLIGLKVNWRYCAKETKGQFAQRLFREFKMKHCNKGGAI